MNSYRKGIGIRPADLLLMAVFTFSSLALMWTAVDCFKRINQGYNNASQGMAAAQFIANKLRRADEAVLITADSDGRLESIIISDGDYENIIRADNGIIREGLVRKGSSFAGNILFTADSVTVTRSNASPELIRISASYDGGKTFTAYAGSSAQISFSDSDEEVRQ